VRTLLRAPPRLTACLPLCHPAKQQTYRAHLRLPRCRFARYHHTRPCFLHARALSGVNMLLATTCKRGCYDSGCTPATWAFGLAGSSWQLIANYLLWKGWEFSYGGVHALAATFLVGCHQGIACFAWPGDMAVWISATATGGSTAAWVAASRCGIFLPHQDYNSWRWRRWPRGRLSWLC